MFAMLNGAWPRVTSDGIDLAALEADVAAGRAVATDLEAAKDRLVAEVLAAQAEAGLDLVTDGQVRWPDMTEAVRLAIVEGHAGNDGHARGGMEGRRGSGTIRRDGGAGGSRPVHAGSGRDRRRRGQDAGGWRGAPAG